MERPNLMGRAGFNRWWMKVMVQVEFDLFGVVKRKGKWYIASCPPLDLATQGRTNEEAKKNLLEASELFIVSCIERGTLDQALKELGLVPLKGRSAAIPPDAFPMAIPIPAIGKKGADWDFGSSMLDGEEVCEPPQGVRQPTDNALLRHEGEDGNGNGIIWEWGKKKPGSVGWFFGPAPGASGEGLESRDLRIHLYATLLSSNEPD